MTTTKRIDAILNARGMSRRQLAIEANIPPSSFQSAMARGRNMTIEMLQAIAATLKVSADYLLGATDDPAPRPSAVDELGLSPGAIDYLQSLHKINTIFPRDNKLHLLSYFLENNRFDFMLALCVTYINLMHFSYTPYDIPFAISDTYKEYESTLEKHGFVISSPQMQANALFCGQITDLLRAILDEGAEQQDERLLFQQELDEALNESPNESERPR